jgi:hypothetical protein
MMNAPRPKVFEKFLGAHKKRSLNMIHQFKIKFLSAMPINAGKKSSDANTTKKTIDVSATREFHQSLIVGLIEACKGLFELYGRAEMPKSDEG